MIMRGLTSYFNWIAHWFSLQSPSPIDENTLIKKIRRHTGRLVHVLKILPHHYHDVICGDKTAEIRYNDRDYHVGDLILFKPLNRIILSSGDLNRIYQVTHILDYPDGLKANYVCLSIKLWTKDDIMAQSFILDKGG